MTASTDVAGTDGRILIVEDSPTQAEELRYLLEEHGYRVTAATSGAQALAAARKEKPALILSDIVMREMDGYAFCKAVKSEDQLKDVPVILVTSLSSARDVIKGLECGADNFIRKPYEEKYLLARIQYAMTNRMLRSTEKVQIGVHILLGGERHFITADRQQILDLLISTYEEAVHVNEDLKAKEEQLARANLMLAGLYRIAKALNTATSEREVIERLLERAMELPGVQAGWIALREGDAAFRLAGARGLPPALEAPGAMEGDCLCHRRLLSGELSQVTNILECERLQKAQGDTRGMRCHASVPLWTADRMVGVMNLVGSQEGLFRDEELPILNGIGNQIALALERARLSEHLEAAVEDRTAALRLEINERELAEDALRRSEERYRLLAEAAHDDIVVVKRDGSLEYINDFAARKFGVPPAQLVGKRLADLFPPGTVAPQTEGLEKVFRTGEAVYQEFSAVFPSQRLWLGAWLVPLKQDGGDINAVLVIARDLTERKALEAQFRQAQKMESVGQLAGGIAHDFNNLLTIITGTVELALTQVREGDPLLEDLHEIHRAGERAAALTRQLLAFSRKQILQPKVLDLNTLVVDMQSMLGRLLGEDIDLAFTPSEGLGFIKADPGQMEQVIANLAVNARDAMPQGGKLTIETRNVAIDEPYARQHGVAVAPGSYVMLAVSDTGIGMDEDTRRRIFEPFFTTKGPGKGTGLGLSTVYGIVKQSDGFVWAYSEMGQGTSFRIYLPQAAEAANSKQPRPTVAPAHGTETILIVEDVAGLRHLAKRILESAGYTVLTAANGQEALLLLEDHDQPVHLMVTDVVMPGLSGRNLAEAFGRTRPGLKVLYMSGYTDDVVVRHGVLDENMPFLGKPFTTAGLLRKVRDVLDSES